MPPAATSAVTESPALIQTMATSAPAALALPSAVDTQATVSPELEVEMRGLHHEARIAGQSWLASANARGYTIQLMLCWEDQPHQQAARDTLMEALQAVQMADNAFLVTTAKRNRPASMLTLGEFHTKGEALNALATLPVPLRPYQPFVRRIAGLQKEVFGASVKTAQARLKEEPR